MRKHSPVAEKISHHSFRVEMKIGYVCTNFNNSIFTLQAIRTLLSNKDHDYHIVVVDNNSNLDDVELLREMSSQFSCLRLILNNENIGYFRGLNLGISQLRSEHADIDWMVVGNNDLEFPSDFSDNLAEHASRLSAHAVVSPDVITVDGQHQNPHVISNISTIREIFYDLYYSNYYLGLLIHKLAMMFRVVSDRADEEQWQVAQPISQGHGSCYLLGPRFFEQFKELWAPTFLMSEEFFLSKQLGDVGQQVYYEPAIQVVHHWHASLAKLPSKQRWLFARDAHRVYRKYVKIFP